MDPDQLIGRLRHPGPRVSYTILREWERDRAGAVPGATPLPECPWRRLRAAPEADAVVFEDERLELRRARCRARPPGASPARLSGLGPEVGAGLCIGALAGDAGWGLLASSRPGVPISVSHPALSAQRLAFMLADAARRCC